MVKRGQKRVGVGGLSKKSKVKPDNAKASSKMSSDQLANEDTGDSPKTIEIPIDSIPDLLKIYAKKYQEVIASSPSSLPEESSLYKNVPLAYRAQIEDRCQPQRIIRYPPNGIQDSVRFVNEWIGETEQRNAALAQVKALPYRNSDPFHNDGQFRNPSHALSAHVQIDWRLLSNSGQFADMICPVIGAGGWPFIPGSSIKGLFKRSCSPQQMLKWCGMETNQTITPGLLRFHGAWPVDTAWTQGLLDLTHPQENWQVGFSNRDHNANAVISLLQPNLIVAISSTKPLDPSEWSKIKAVLTKALGFGIGGRTASGYGIPRQEVGLVGSDFSSPLFSLKLRGQGPASKLLDGSAEIRPLMFRAAIRSMALRLFAGIVDSNRAQMEVKRLFGGFNPGGKPYVGLLASRFSHLQTPLIGRFGEGPNQQDVFVCDGQLSWHLTQNTIVDRDCLGQLVGYLHALVVALGGFGRSWRRPDHRIFLPSYRTRPIGCYWESGQLTPGVDLPTSSEEIRFLLENAASRASQWLKKETPIWRADLPLWTVRQTFPIWREVIHPKRMIVWSRVIDSAEMAMALRWTHAPLHDENRAPALNLSQSKLKGSMGLVSRLWISVTPISRMCDTRNLQPVSSRPQYQDCNVQLKDRSNGPFLETVTCFPDPDNQNDDQYAFINYMQQGAGANPPFKHTWGEF
jgi:CRISPR-associated protein Cmr6